MAIWNQTHARAGPLDASFNSIEKVTGAVYSSIKSLIVIIDCNEDVNISFNLELMERPNSRLSTLSVEEWFLSVFVRGFGMWFSICCSCGLARIQQS